MNTPLVTYGIIGITAVISLIAFSNKSVLEQFIFYPYGVKKENEYPRFLTHGFIHANLGHLLFNMITLFFFGPTVEEYFTIHFGDPAGKLVYFGLYLVSIVVSSIPAFVKHKSNIYYRSLGASGAVSAILFSSILIDPLTSLIIIPIPIPIPAWLFGPLYLLYSAYMSRRGGDNIGHDAHFMGAVFGLIATVILIPSSFSQFLEQLSTVF